MSIITLAIDSTGKAGSVCLLEDEKLLGELYMNTGFTHSATLLPMIDSLFKITGKSLSNVDRIALTVGPGSFTGLRIGISCVKGLAFADNIPTISLSTLEVLAYSAMGEQGIICAVMDARRNEVYNALFRWENDRLIRLCEDRALNVEELKAELIKMGESIYLVGDGAELCKSQFDCLTARVALEHRCQQRALYAALMSRGRETISAHDIKPTYLRLSQAERELLERENSK